MIGPQAGLRPCLNEYLNLEAKSEKPAANYKKMHNFKMDSQTVMKFSAKVAHEPEDSWLTVKANWQKGGVACNKKTHNF